jgi:2-polyprenyl-6-methoxyphenol hydroxylase-like FAD-dependent oxidoreductase
MTNLIIESPICGGNIAGTHMNTPTLAAPVAATPEILDIRQTDCCIVGGGPAGAVLALLLARQGIKVILLEVHRDLDRDFRGDTIHPSTMEIMAELGLADRVLALPHTKISELNIRPPSGVPFHADFRGLNTKYPFITVMPQVKFLEFIVAEAERYPNFQAIMGANVQELVTESDTIRGVRYRGHGGWHEIRALLTVGADGRHSKVRELIGEVSTGNTPPLDVLWFRLPRHSSEPTGLSGRIGKGAMMAMVDRGELWQIAYIFPKDGYQQIRHAGLAALRESIVATAPELIDRVELLQDWSQIAFLSVESGRIDRWYRAGLLLIGDAAHPMSPVAGVGINYAIQDAVVAANLLSQPLRSGVVKVENLAKVQRQRELPTRIIQGFQSIVQNRIVAQALATTDTDFKLPWLMRLPWFRYLPPRLIGLGVFPVHVRC